ncbi:hypothetical protein FBQ95_17005 [Chloroflexi bacterium CFX3]|nr:hypothetical protein [Chloroflexi bacterium CFX3]
MQVLKDSDGMLINGACNAPQMQMSVLIYRTYPSGDGGLTTSRRTINVAEALEGDWVFALDRRSWEVCVVHPEDAGALENAWYYKRISRTYALNKAIENVLEKFDFWFERVKLPKPNYD